MYSTCRRIFFVQNSQETTYIAWRDKNSSYGAAFSEITFEGVGKLHCIYYHEWEMYYMRRERQMWKNKTVVVTHKK